MVETRLMLVTAALLLAALLHESSAGVVNEDGAQAGRWVVGLEPAEAEDVDLTATASGSDEQDHSPTSTPQDVSPDAEKASQLPSRVQAASVTEDADEDPAADVENEVLPPTPAFKADGQQKQVPHDIGFAGQVEAGQPGESRYRHGVAPAKLPALETDNAHGYRHSIIHPYGDDLHA